MNICLYSPYIPKHVGGGEKYLFDVAEVLSQRHMVSIAIPAEEMANEADIRAKYESFLNRSLEKIAFVATPLGSGASFFTKLGWTKQFDVLYYASDGSLFFSMAKKNILHIQLPLRLNKSGFMERLKLANWRVKNTNSTFTKKIVEPSWPVHIDVVHHPMVEVDDIKTVASSVNKEKVILSVGRFFRQLHSKRQDILIRMFEALTEIDTELVKDWKLVLIGGVENEQYLKEVKQLAQGLPVEILTDVSRSELLTWYGRASIYWHAAGFEVDEQQHPEKVEHFGISTVEAMAAGCVPLVHGKGGQIEVMGDELADLLWLSDDECVQKTVALMKNHKQRETLSKQVQARAAVFGPEAFARKLWSMVEGRV